MLRLMTEEESEIMENPAITEKEFTDTINNMKKKTKPQVWTIFQQRL